MIRLILRKSVLPPNVSGEVFTMKTVDLDAPELEEILNVNGFTDNGFETVSIDGFEILEETLRKVE